MKKVAERFYAPGVSIAIQIPDELPPVEMDGGRIEIVLHNLIANGLVYGEGEVQITAERREEAIVVAVTDNGPGIDPDELPHVFERFYRAQRGLQQHSGGTGLGLTICKAFIEAHGGVIWAENSVQGATIAFSLPLVTPVVSVAATHSGSLRTGERQ